MSKAKVDHLGGQSPETLRDKVDVKVGVDLMGLGNAEIGSRTREPTLFQRAEDLCEALRKAGKVGDFSEDDKPYVQGTMFATWGFWSRQISGHADVVLFTALVSANTIVGLGGSAFHTLERPEERLQRWSNSGHAVLLEFLNWQSQYIGDDQSKMTSPWYHEMLETDSDKAAPREAIEFVAQRLDVHDGEEHLGFRALLGSPIYVARTGQPTTSRMNRNYEALRDLFWQQRGLNSWRDRRNRRLHANRSYRTPPEFDPQLPPAS